jgi:hypothetical protein
LFRFLLRISKRRERRRPLPPPLRVGCCTLRAARCSPRTAPSASSTCPTHSSMMGRRPRRSRGRLQQLLSRKHHPSSPTTLLLLRQGPQPIWQLPFLASYRPAIRCCGTCFPTPRE